MGAILMLATRSVGHDYVHVANTLPNDLVLQLIGSTASMLNTTTEAVQSTLDTLHTHDVAEVLEAMQDLGTGDVVTLTAYLDGASVLDMSLDGWLLDEVG